MFDSNKKITVADLKKLDKHITDNFIEDDAEDLELEMNKDIYWVEGYLCAVVSSPEPIIPMDDWLPYAGVADGLKSRQHLNDIMCITLSLKNSIAKKLDSDSYVPLYEKHNVKNEQKDGLVTKWSKGYIFATMMFHDWFLEENQDINNELEGGIVALISPIFAGTNVGLDKKLRDDKTIKAIPLAVKLFYALSSNVRHQLLSEATQDR